LLCVRMCCLVLLVGQEFIVSLCNVFYRALLLAVDDRVVGT